MKKFNVTVNGVKTFTTTAEAFYLNYGLNLLKTNPAGIVRDRFNEYKITPAN